MNSMPLRKKYCVRLCSSSIVFVCLNNTWNAFQIKCSSFCTNKQMKAQTTRLNQVAFVYSSQNRTEMDMKRPKSNRSNQTSRVRCIYYMFLYYIDYALSNSGLCYVDRCIKFRCGTEPIMSCHWCIWLIIKNIC